MPWGLLGLENPVSILSGLLKAGRLPHALLFTGPAGGGKNSLALALAALLNCARPDPDAGPCGDCPSCRQTARGLHPDLITPAPGWGREEDRRPDEPPDLESGAPPARAKLWSIWDIRKLRRVMAPRPLEGRMKVLILREADRLGPEAAQALLKTLEEPPRGSSFILTSAVEGQVIATIRSRCLTLRLPHLSQETMLGVLAEKKGLTGPPARLLVALAGGALGPALAGDPEAAWNRWLSLNQIFGAESAGERLGLAWRWSLAVSEDRGGWPEALNLLRLWWRETLRLSALGPAGPEGPPPRPAQIRWADQITPELVERAGLALNRLARGLERITNKPELLWANYWLTVLDF